MPFYEYECASCKFYTEVMQKISDRPLEKCPSCGKKALKKLVSAPVFRLKGGGWYETDFKSDKENKRNLADRDDSSSKSDEAKPAKTGDAKTPAAEAPAKSGGDAERKSSGDSDRKSSGDSERKSTAKRPASGSKAKSKPAAKPIAKKAPKKAAGKKGRR